MAQGISMYTKPGQLTALMGGSGAGKTTLMVEPPCISMIRGGQLHGTRGAAFWHERLQPCAARSALQLPLPAQCLLCTGFQHYIWRSQNCSRPCCRVQDVVCGRKTQGIVRGEILVNGHPKVQATWSRVVG